MTTLQRRLPACDVRPTSCSCAPSDLAWGPGVQTSQGRKSRVAAAKANGRDAVYDIRHMCPPISERRADFQRVVSSPDLVAVARSSHAMPGDKEWPKMRLRIIKEHRALSVLRLESLLIELVAFLGIRVGNQNGGCHN